MTKAGSSRGGCRRWAVVAPVVALTLGSLFFLCSYPFVVGILGSPGDVDPGWFRILGWPALLLIVGGGAMLIASALAQLTRRRRSRRW